MSTTAIVPVEALAEQAAHCGDQCEKEGRADCAKVCHDTAKACVLVADFLKTDAHGSDAFADALIEMARACAVENERHQVEHCQMTAKLAREAVTALSQEAATTPRTPAGERL